MTVRTGDLQGSRFLDIPSMARLAVSSSWPRSARPSAKQVTESFGRYISAIYADRFDSYAGQKLQVTGEQPAAAGVWVHARSSRPRRGGQRGHLELLSRIAVETVA